MAGSGFKKFDPYQWLQKERGNHTQIPLGNKVTLAHLAVLAGVQANIEKNDEKGDETISVKNEPKVVHFPLIENQKIAWTPAKTAKSANAEAATKYYFAFDALKLCCPDYVEYNRWVVALMDGERFLEMWNRQAEALGW